MDSEKVRELLDALERYRKARVELLFLLGVPHSNHEPLAEWSEHLVAALLDGQLARSPTQLGWDLTTPAGHKIQVRSLANRAELKGAWVNEHSISFTSGVDGYALVIFEGLRPLAVLTFPTDLRAINKKLNKKAKNPKSTLELTRKLSTNHAGQVDLPTARRRGLDVLRCIALTSFPSTAYASDDSAVSADRDRGSCVRITSRG